MIVEIGKVLMGYQNQEQIVSEILRQYKKRRLFDVELEDGKLLLTFSDKENWNGKLTVKQFSKKRYANQDECISKFVSSNLTSQTLLPWWVIKVIDLPNKWLIFFERNF